MDLNQPTLMIVAELEKIGIDSQKVIVEYQIKKGINLNINELIKVSSKDEGKTIDFETLDQISITVTAINSDGSYNKID